MPARGPALLWRALLCGALLAGAVGCDDGDSEAAASVRVVAAGVERIDRLTVVIKREGAGDAGATSRQVQETSFAVSGDQVVGKPFRLREAWVPDGDGAVYVHAVAYADDAIVGIGDGRAGDGTGSHLITIRPYDAACDLDGDTYLDCGNLRAGCCQSLEARDHAAFEDCHDDPAAVGSGADLKTRDAKLASPFAPTEDAASYAFCENGLDEDCANGDAPCAAVDADADGFTVSTDCDDTNPDINPDAYDVPGDGVDQNCDGAEGTGTDADGDGFFGDDPDPARRDCDDDNRFVNPGAPEVPCNAIDDDCRGGDACAMGADLDGDGVSPPEDCDDMDAGRRPGAREQCGDGIDQDCDGSDLACPEGDLDGDGFTGDDDCDETDKLVYRGAPERCDDGVDQDCDGADRPCPPDGDVDGDGWVVPDDCDDDDRDIRPGADEVCDAVDQDCDGTVDEGNPLRRADGTELEPTCGRDVGLCQLGPNVCTRDPDNGTAMILCMGIQPQPEVCDGLDNDCDGTTDLPADGDEVLADEAMEACGPAAEVGVCQRGLLGVCRNGRYTECVGAVEPSPEQCNGLDDDCDGDTDEGAGGAERLTEACFDGPDAARNQGMCRDGIRVCRDGTFSACDGQLLPAEEGCNAIDDDCDGQVDETTNVACYTGAPGTENVGVCRGGNRACEDGLLSPDCVGQITPTQEVCDDQDNDCDGQVDRNIEQCFGVGQVPPPDPALIGVGLCRAGTRRCFDGVFGVCQGEILPAAEACNQRDDDCDGETDEDFDFLSDPNFCGTCDIACEGGEACCEGRCTDLGTLANCAGCGDDCAAQGADRCVETPQGAECRCGDGPACGAGLICDGGICQCRDDEDCGEEQLCCANDQGIRECVPTDPASQCEACGVACNGDRSNSCENRQCRCGDSVTCQVGTVCQDDAQTPEPDFQCRGCATNAQCDANTICCRGTCVRTDPEQQCEGCGVACDINVADFCAGVAGGLERSCVCGSGAGATACEGPTPVCVLGQRPGEGNCRECRNDVDCTGNPDFADRNLRECVQNDCRRCDPVNHDGCGANQLCCNDRCVDTVATGNDPGCEACGQACDANRTNQCTARGCACGNNAPCGGDTPFCRDGDGQCVECIVDGHCGGGQCVDNVCEVCDPADDAGCALDQQCCARGGRITCEPTSPDATGSGQCEECNEACNPVVTNQCASRTCQCGSNAPCDPDGALPVCRDATGQCVECLGDADCNSRPGRSQCVNFQCRPCDPADHAACQGNQLCCAAGGTFACEGTQGGAAGQCERCDQACGVASDRCTNRGCRCGNGAPCAGGTPFCVTGACFECRDNGDCAANELCCGGACQATDDATQCETCGDPCDAAATNQCDGNRNCKCGNNEPCGGNTPFCDDGRGQCVNCRDNGDCGGGNGQCVNNVCQECNPNSTAGCAETSAEPICDPSGACRACQNDGECATRPGPRNQCVGVRCQRCDPADNAGCPAMAPVCDANSFTCRPCGNDAECGEGLECVDGLCQGCDPGDDSPCGAQTPICDPDDATCRGCVDDQECVERPGPEDQCVSGRCELCDPQSHDGCGGNQLCCNLQCVNATTNGCESCGVACDAAATNRCASRTCQCGNNAECAGQTSFCADARGVCVGCRNDGDCTAGDRRQCVADSCERCDPADDAGCNLNGAAPTCDSGSLTCRACANDGDCAGNPNGGQCLADGRCGACDPQDDAGCQAGGLMPSCEGDPPACVACDADGDCGGNPNGAQCVTQGARDGACSPCDPADGAGCNRGSATPVCDQATAMCRGCANNAECVGNNNGPICAAGRCRQCDPADDEGCAPASTSPICAGATPACRACANDGECAGNPAGTQCVAAGADPGACRGCDPANDAGCNAGGNAPICDANNYQCRGCSGDAECAGNPNGGQCVDGACEACDPADGTGCDENSPTPVCGGNPPMCRGCQNDTECNGNPNGGQCVNGSCELCDPNGDAGCDGASNTPICDGGDLECRACGADGECVGNPNGAQCVAGACESCDPADDAGCDPNGNAPVCDAGDQACRACANDGECADNPNGAQCVAGVCAACDPANGMGCDAGGAAPICDGGTRTCRACAADGECTGNASGEQCVAGACESCDPADHAGCDLNGNAPACSGAPPACGQCAGPEDCAGNPNGNLCLPNGSCDACTDDTDCDGHPAGATCTNGNCG